MEIKFLGTVSPYCKDEKNCPGYLITHENEKILLDCGNGISRYLNMPDDLEDLTIIISHLHSDHYGELLSLAQTSYVFHKLGLLKNICKGAQNEFTIKCRIYETTNFSSRHGQFY